MNAERQIYSVTEMNEFVASLLAQTRPLHNVWLKAEISGLRLMGKAWYFTLKDAQARIAAVFFVYGASLPRFVKDGDSVLVFGKIALYAPSGSYQFVVSQFESLGEGDMLLKLKQLKEKLAKEGLFDASRKRDIPAYMTHIGVIAGKDSAAIKDVIHNVHRRFPMMEITFFPSLVQGPNAPVDLIRALSLAYTYPLQTLVITRGGGAEEDLSAFNDERVVRKVAESPMPTIAAIGHEINWSLVDLVADLRVSTPTAAAEKVTIDYHDILENLTMTQGLLSQKIQSLIRLYNEKVDAWLNRSWLKDPSLLYARQMELLTQKQERLKLIVEHRFTGLRQIIDQKHQNLILLNPQAVLKRGFAIVLSQDGNVISSIDQVSEKMPIRTQLADGIITSTVQTKEKKNHE